MKFSKYLMMAGAAAMLTACSSEEPFVPQGDPMTEEIANNDTYALISLAMPEATGTRGAAEPETSKIESEYKVANGSLLIWETGATEDDAKYVTRVNFTGAWNATTGEVVDISREATVQVQFPKGTFESTKNYAGLVVLNAPSNYPFPTTNQTFGIWKNTENKAQFTYTANGQTYLTMASAPDNERDGAVLVEIPASSIAGSLEDITEAMIIDGFYVQRNAAKVTLTAAGNVTGQNHVYALAGAYEGATVTVNGWATDVKAVASTPIQDVSFAAIKDEWIDNTNFPNFQRIHWGKSFFYGKTYNSDNYSYVSAISSFPENEYIKENTLKAKEQLYKHTTRVVLKATYKTGATATDLIKMGNTTELLTRDGFKALVEDKLENVVNKKGTVTLKAGSAGYKSLTDLVTVTTGSGDNAPELSDADYTTLAEALGMATVDEEGFAYYAGGVCYYPILIKHFAEDTIDDINTKDDYTDAHEGRYGVLRNNWYDINVNSISKIGQPTIPDPKDDDTPDDKKTDEFDAVKVAIQMLNWAKRSQNVTL